MSSGHPVRRQLKYSMFKKLSRVIWPWLNGLQLSTPTCVEDLASLAEMGQAALAQIQEASSVPVRSVLVRALVPSGQQEARTPPRNPEPFSEQKEVGHQKRKQQREHDVSRKFLTGA